MSDVSVTNPKDFVFEAERILATAPQGEYSAMRRVFIEEAEIRFGHDIAREIADALPLGSLPSPN